MGIKQLQQAADSLPPEYQEIQTRSVALAAAVVRGFLGLNWFLRYVEKQTAPKSIFTIDESDPIRKELSLLRLIDLAEVLYNLQHAPGFDECIGRMRDGVIEGTFAELDFGRMLYFNQVPFRFVAPQGVKKRDYDIEILYPNNLIACADAKCKIDATQFTDNGIRNVLKEARAQLPNDRPGIVFVKVPARWIADEEFLSTAGIRARRFLGGAPRIVSVKFYASSLVFEDNVVTHQHAYKEFSNPKTNFGDGINWDIFDKAHSLTTNGGIPDHWQRILFFPAGQRTIR